MCTSWHVCHGKYPFFVVRCAEIATNNRQRRRQAAKPSQETERRGAHAHPLARTHAHVHYFSRPLPPFSCSLRRLIQNNGRRRGRNEGRDITQSGGTGGGAPQEKGSTGREAESLCVSQRHCEQQLARAIGITCNEPKNREGDAYMKPVWWNGGYRGRGIREEHTRKKKKDRKQQ